MNKFNQNVKRVRRYLKVALHFWPWERAFWLGLLHDSMEDGWLIRIPYPLSRRMCLDIRDLSRSAVYAECIEQIQQIGGDVKRVKIAVILVNYKRATPSLRKRYAKALLILADDGGADEQAN